jgi:hypothetical protein
VTSTGGVLDDGQWQLDVDGGLAAPDTELIKMLDPVTFARPANPSSWYPISAVLPHS